MEQWPEWKTGKDPESLNKFQLVKLKVVNFSSIAALCKNRDIGGTNIFLWQEKLYFSPRHKILFPAAGETILLPGAGETRMAANNPLVRHRLQAPRLVSTNQRAGKEEATNGKARFAPPPITRTHYFDLCGHSSKQTFTLG